MRLDRLLVLLAVGSRTEVQRLIRAGRVSVNGVRARDPMTPADGLEISVDGQALDTRLERALMMNKPSGVLTAADDKTQKTVMDLLAPVYKTLGCMPVGRLDKDTTGLLLFTTDGTLAHRLISPNHDVKKIYLATVDSDLKDDDRSRFEHGMHFKDFDALPARLDILEARLARVTVSEGKYHQVKRMLHAVGHETLALTRLSFGPLALDERLAPGETRELTGEEMAALYETAGMKN